MLVIDGKTQMLVDRYLDQYGQTLIGSETGAGPFPEQPTAAVALTQPAEPSLKKGGLRFKNLRKQPLGHSNEMESQ